jgi:hypothetical protein
MPSEDSSADERIHKWKACAGCDHPRHSMRCVAGDTTECGCLALVPATLIVETCRLAGGCPKHPILESPDSASSSPDDPCECGQKRYAHTDDVAGACVECPAGMSLAWRHEFAPAEPECYHPEDWPGECPCLPSCGCCKATPVSAPRRPPYAVAYATVGGAQYEIALPGDASVRAVDGALIITHDSAVLALSHVRPMEGQ